MAAEAMEYTPTTLDPTPQAFRRAIALAFAPLHKRAFGLAIGSAAAVVVFLVTIIYILRAPEDGFQLGLLNQYFAGYSVSFGGAVVGAAWAFVSGFVAGWFLAFCRNLVIAASIFIIRARSEMAQTRDFLDHI